MDAVETDQVVERIKTVVAEVLRIDAGRIGLSSRFTEDLGADSLDKVTLLMALEDEFGKSISDDEAGKFVDIKAVVDFITSSSEGKGE